MEVLMPIATLTLSALLLSPSVLAQEAPGEGDLVITELLIAPANSHREWFEVENVSGVDLELQGCVLAESGNDDTIDDSLVIAAGERAVLAKSSSTDQTCAAYGDEGLTSCNAEVAAFYGSLTFNNSGTETLSITCGKVLVDQVSYDWGAFSDDCPDEYGNNCTVNLASEAVDAAANDDPANWCVPWQATPTWDYGGSPSLNTAGEPGLCVLPPDPCTDGVVITELMAAPSDGYNEYIELYGVNSEACNLNGCTLMVGQSDDVTYEPTEEDDWSWKLTTIEATYDTLELVPGEHLLLAKGEDWVVGDGTSEPDLPADYNYGTVTLSNSNEEWVHLVCDGQVMDSAPSSWGAFSDFCPEGGCSVNLAPSAYDATSNDALESWCIPPLEAVYTGPEGDLFRGTPGAEGACMSLAWPAEGEVIFTEVMATPQGGIPEYLELYNTGTAELDLTFCTLRKHRLDEAGEVDEGSIDEYLIGEDSRTLSMAAGAVQLLSYGDCLPWGDLDTAETTDTGGEGTAACAQGEFPYRSIQISSDPWEHLSLVCPDGAGGELVVDAIALSFSELGVRAGHALMLEPERATATDNDADSAWCEAAFSQKIDELSDDIEDCNYGTPGVLDPCLEDQPEPLQPVCRCSSQARPSGWFGLALLSLAAVLRGRRRERNR
jgi:hypothetical protein